MYGSCSSVCKAIILEGISDSGEYYFSEVALSMYGSSSSICKAIITEGVNDSGEL